MQSDKLLSVLNRVNVSGLSNVIPDNSSISDFRNVALSLQPTVMKILKDNNTTLL